MKHLVGPKRPDEGKWQIRVKIRVKIGCEVGCEVYRAEYIDLLPLRYFKVL